VARQDVAAVTDAADRVSEAEGRSAD
jgi:hypothetical protein